MKKTNIENRIDQHTISYGHLAVGNGHKIFYEQWGVKHSKTPVLFFHGGPGGSCSPGQKQIFDPSKHQVIFFDQRGGGESTPKGSLERNSTDDLLDDAIKLLDHFKIQKAALFGGSWGSTLALLFAIKYPERVTKIVVRGIFLADEDIEFVDQGRFKTFVPEVWEHFLTTVPKSWNKPPTDYHYNEIESGDPKRQLRSAAALENLEAPLLSLDDRYHFIDLDKIPDDYDPTSYIIYGHYMKSHCFIERGFILENAKYIKVPTYVVQGRYDMVCPFESAWKLMKVLPDGHFFPVVAGHSASDRPLYDTLKTLASTVL